MLARLCSMHTHVHTFCAHTSPRPPHSASCLPLSPRARKRRTHVCVRAVRHARPSTGDDLHRRRQASSGRFKVVVLRLQVAKDAQVDGCQQDQRACASRTLPAVRARRCASQRRSAAKRTASAHNTRVYLRPERRVIESLVDVIVGLLLQVRPQAVSRCWMRAGHAQHRAQRARLAVGQQASPLREGRGRKPGREREGRRCAYHGAKATEGIHRPVPASLLLPHPHLQVQTQPQL